eukprot:6021765-Pyramimonas_sp.AAC.1
MSRGILGDPDELEDIQNNPEEPIGIPRTPWGDPEGSSDPRDSWGILGNPGDSGRSLKNPGGS